MMRRLVIALVLLGALSCGDDGPSRPSSPPWLQSVCLTPDSVLVDTVLVAVEAERADSVAWWVDGARAAVDTEAPFLFAWNSHSVSDGRHSFALRAHGDGGYADTAFSRSVKNYGDLEVVITAAPSLVRLERSYQLEAEITSGPPTTLAWSVAEGPSHGIVDDSGLYVAPAVLPNPPVVTFRATALGSPPAVAEAVADMAERIVVTMRIAPRSILPGETYQLAAMVGHTADHRVRWSLDEGPDHGVIDENGLYTAPSVGPASSEVTFRATSLADTLESGTATGYIIGTVNLVVTPHSTWLYPNDQASFTAHLDGAPPEAVSWTVLELPTFGTITQAGIYTAPAAIPDPPRALVVAWCPVAPEARDTAVVELRKVPPDPVLLREMYETVFAAVSLSEQVTGIAGTALGMARYLGGDDAIQSGGLIEEAHGWAFYADGGNRVWVDPLTGPTASIDYETAAGTVPAQDGYRRFCSGVEFKGELDFLLRPYPPAPNRPAPNLLTVTNSSRPISAAAKPGSWAAGAEFERTLKGKIAGAQGGLWEVDLSVTGEMWTGYDAVYSYQGAEVTVSGSFTTPSGIAVEVETAFTRRSTSQQGLPSKLLSLTQSYEGGFTARVGDDVYTWQDISFFRTWSYKVAKDLDQWHASGTILKNGEPLGEVRFDGPVTGGMTLFPSPVAYFELDVQVPLADMPLLIGDPTRPAASPFQSEYW